MTISEIQTDTRFWQRMLRLAGYYTGKVDGIAGPLTRAAEAKWLTEAQRAAKEYGTYDDRSEAVIATLLPQAQALARRWMSAATKEAVRQRVCVKLIDGTRSYKEQNRLYAKRPKVTNARGGSSWHNFGLAFDFGVFSEDGKKYYGESPLYKVLGKLATAIPGATWGGTWTSLVDEPHIQLATFNTVKAAREAFEQ